MVVETQKKESQRKSQTSEKSEKQTKVDSKACCNVIVVILFPLEKIFFQETLETT